MNTLTLFPLSSDCRRGLQLPRPSVEDRLSRSERPHIEAPFKGAREATFYAGAPSTSLDALWPG